MKIGSGSGCDHEKAKPGGGGLGETTGEMRLKFTVCKRRFQTFG